MRLRNVAQILLLTVLLSCSSQESSVQIPPPPVQQPVDDKRPPDDSVSIAIGSLALTWDQPVGTASGFDIYFLSNRNDRSQAVKIANVAVGGTEAQTLVVTPDLIRNAKQKLPPGGDFCFFVVALNSSVPSEPSDVACLTLDE